MGGLRSASNARVWHAIFAQRRLACGQWRAGSGAARPGGPAVRVVMAGGALGQQKRWRKISEKDRKEAAMDGWQRVNEGQKKKGSLFGVKMDLSENPRGKGMFDEKRMPSGSTHDHAFPVHPYYPRIADKMTKETAQAIQKRIPQARKAGNGVLIVVMIVFIGSFSIGIDAVFMRPEAYWSPPAHYTNPEYVNSSLRMEHVVYVDVAVDGRDVGRVHIGLFHNDAPAWCENFHRLASAGEDEVSDDKDAPKGRESLKGTLFWKCSGPCLYGGDSKGIDGHDGRLALGRPLPEDTHNNHSFPFGVYAAGGFIHHVDGMNDSNFIIMLEEGRVAVAGDFSCVGMVVKGFSTVELIANLPRQPYPYFVPRVEVTGCGISDLDGDNETIVQRLRKFHKGRVRRFLATQPSVKAKYDAAVMKNERDALIKDKKKQVESELRETREKLAEAASA